MSDFLNPHVTRPAIRWTSGDPLPAVDQTGLAAPLLVDATTGALLVSGGGGGGGSTDMGPTNAKLDTLIGIETTEAADIALTKAEAISIDGKLPALSGGNIPVEANNASSQVYNYTATGVVAINTVLIGPINCSQFREVSVQIVSAGSGFSLQGQISNDGTNWFVCPAFINNGNIGIGQFSAAQIYNYTLSSSRFFRVTQNSAQTAGTTTLVAYASQQATPKLYQSVLGSVTTQTNITGIALTGTGSGFSLYHSLVSSASTNATLVKNSVGTIGSLILTNSSATWAYFKLVNKASAPTVGTDTAVINIGVAPNSTLDCSSSFCGLRLTTGIAYYVSGGASLTDNTALLAAGTFLVNMTYI